MSHGRIDNKWVAVKPHGGAALTEDKNRERAKDDVKLVRLRLAAVLFLSRHQCERCLFIYRYTYINLIIDLCMYIYIERDLTSLYLK